MASWSTRRRATYLSIVLGIVFVAIVVPVFFAYYDQPTCFDGKKNGDEVGVDCGGRCELLCPSEAVSPTVLWSRAFKVSGDVYNAAAYIENRNPNSQTIASYAFNFYDQSNSLITSREGRTFIPKNKVFAIFEPNIDMGGKAPYRVSFGFKEPLAWKKDMSVNPEIEVVSKSLTGEETTPRVQADIKNPSSTELADVEVVAIIYDNRENAIAASRTFIDTVASGETQTAFFTWPLPFRTEEEICRVSGDDLIGERPQALGAMIVIDRSGSMSSQGKNPPQPLTTVKNAALSFVDELRGTDKIGLASFATEASSPIDSSLTSDFTSLKSSIEKISILSGKTQYTNLGEGIAKAAGELLAPAYRELTERVIILLTDGIATHPEKDGEGDYPAIFAFEKAREAKTAGVELYIIGLGNEVNTDFLKQIANTPEHYFAAATSKELKEIYSQIAVKICKVGPSVVEIIPRTVPIGL